MAAKQLPHPSRQDRPPKERIVGIAITPAQEPDAIEQRRRIREAFHDSKARTIQKEEPISN